MAFDRHDRLRSGRVEIPVDAAALFLDLDGTLANIETEPDAVGPNVVRTDLLRRAEIAMTGRLAVISGRSLEEIDRIVDKAVPFASGVHGLEHRSGVGVKSAEAHPGLTSAGETLRAFAADRPGMMIEDKGLSLALHYRKAPAAAAGAIELGRRLAAQSGLMVQEGDCVVELRTPGADKGDAVRTFMGSAPFIGAVPIFVGDDLTDEHAFAAVRELGGAGVLVGPARDTAAAARLDGVQDVLEWLDRSIRDGVFRMEALS